MSIETLTRSILQKMTGIGKVQGDFFVHLVLQWLRLRGRYTFEGLFRQGFLSAVSYRAHFSKAFDFKNFNRLLVQRHCELERLWVFDPTYLGKAGKHTYGLGYFWSGCAQAVKRGLELSALSIVDVKNHTAFHYHAAQTVLAEKQTLLTFYTHLIVEQAAELLLLSEYLAVDAYFAKYEFIDTLSQRGLKVITRLRNDAALWYPYVGPKRAGKGRPQQFAGKVDAKNLDHQYFRPCIQEEDWTAYEACLYSKSLKRLLQVVIVQTYQADGGIKSSKLFASTDTTLTGMDLWYYYHLRFQAEFLYRDAKQFLGLTHCQSRQQSRLNFHFNFSLTLLSLAKVAHWLSKPWTERGSFSIQDLKTTYFNLYMLDSFIEGFGLCPITAKNNPVYHQLADYAKIAA
jgi:hypothetical protein